MAVASSSARRKAEMNSGTSRGMSALAFWIVVFPSGGTDPVYISDWEWMFEIFTEAMADQGITDSYCTSIYYPGYMWSGGLCSCFGEPIPIWYKGSDDVVRGRVAAAKAPS